jgi:uncharacterized protein
VRHHDKLARIETDPEGFDILTKPATRKQVYAALKGIGYTYVALDLLGYRTGAMNETLG